MDSAPEIDRPRDRIPQERYAKSPLIGRTEYATDANGLKNSRDAKFLRKTLLPSLVDGPYAGPKTQAAGERRVDMQVPWICERLGT